jgi:hypothetical protein
MDKFIGQGRWGRPRMPIRILVEAAADVTHDQRPKENSLPIMMSSLSWLFNIHQTIGIHHSSINVTSWLQAEICQW